MDLYPKDDDTVHGSPGARRRAGMQILGAVIIVGIVRTVVAGYLGAATATWIALAVIAVVVVVVFRRMGIRP